MVVFNVVFAIVAVLGHRLREAGMEQATLATELKRVRLEADDILRNIRSGVLTVDGRRPAGLHQSDGASGCSTSTAKGLIGHAGARPAQDPLLGALGGGGGRASGTGGRSAGARGW